MSIELSLRLALQQLVEAIEYTPMGVRGIKAVANARKELQLATAIACGIPGMAKTICPYCEQGFAFEYEPPTTGEPVGQVSDLFPSVRNKLHAKGFDSAAPLYTHPTPGVPDGCVLVPLQFLHDASALGNFIMDHGWGDSDMQAMDNLDAYIARHSALTAAKAQKGQP